MYFFVDGKANCIHIPKQKKERKKIKKEKGEKRQGKKKRQKMRILSGGEATEVISPLLSYWEEFMGFGKILFAIKDSLPGYPDGKIPVRVIYTFSFCGGEHREKRQAGIFLRFVKFFNKLMKDRGIKIRVSLLGQGPTMERSMSFKMPISTVCHLCGEDTSTSCSVSFGQEIRHFCERCREDILRQASELGLLRKRRRRR